MRNMPAKLGSIFGLGRPRKAPPFLLAGLFLLSICLGAYCSEAIAFFNEPNHLSMDPVEYGLCYAASVVSIALFCLAAYKYARPKVNWPVLLAVSLLLLGNLVALLVFPSEVSGFTVHLDGTATQYSYALALSDRVRYILSYLLGCAYFYLLFAVLPSCLKGGYSLNFLFFGVVFVAFFACLYSFFKEPEAYAQYFHSDRALDSDLVPESFFYNRNTFGTCLVFGCLALCYLHSKRPFFLNYVLLCFFLVELFFVVSKTSILIAIAVIAAFGVYRFVLTVKRHPLRDCLALSLSVISPVTLFLLGYFKVFGGEDVLSRFARNFLDSLEFSSGPTLLSRRDIYFGAVNMLKDDPIRFLFGVGEYNLGHLLSAMFDTGATSLNNMFFVHNGPIHLLCSGGALRCLIYLFLIVCYVIWLIKAFKADRNIAYCSLLSFLAISVHGINESTSFLIPDVKGYLSLIFVFLPILSLLKGGAKAKGYSPAERIPLLRGGWPYGISLALAAIFAIALPIGLFAFSDKGFVYPILGNAISFLLLLLALSIQGKAGKWGYLVFVPLLGYALFGLLSAFFPSLLVAICSFAFMLSFAIFAIFFAKPDWKMLLFAFLKAAISFAFLGLLCLTLGLCLVSSYSAFAHLCFLLLILLFLSFFFFPEFLSPGSFYLCLADRLLSYIGDRLDLARARNEGKRRQRKAMRKVAKKANAHIPPSQTPSEGLEFA